jgi:hypothetical protein
MPRTKIAHDGILYDVVETVTVKHDDSKLAELLRNNGIIATHGVRRPNGRKVWMLDEYANGTTGNMQAI